jgi:hypothetical protein
VNIVVVIISVVSLIIETSTCPILASKMAVTDILERRGKKSVGTEFTGVIRLICPRLLVSL